MNLNKMLFLVCLIAISLQTNCMKRKYEDISQGPSGQSEQSVSICVNDYIDSGNIDRYVGDTGQTILCGVARQGMMDLCSLLIEEGADVNCADVYGTTPLMAAIEGQKIDIIKLLVANKAKLNLQNKHGHTALFLAIRGKLPLEIVKLLIENMTVDELDMLTLKHTSALSIAIINNDVEVVAILLGRGVKTNIGDTEYGMTSIFYAVTNNSIQIVDMLIKAGVKINIRTKFNEDPLYRALCQEYMDIAALLIKNMMPEDLNIADPEGNTPLMIAVCKNSIKMVDMLIKFGADIDIRNQDNKDALGIALDKGYMEIAKLLNDARTKKYEAKKLIIKQQCPNIIEKNLSFLPTVIINIIKDYADPIINIDMVYEYEKSVWKNISTIINNNY